MLLDAFIIDQIKKREDSHAQPLQLTLQQAEPILQVRNYGDSKYQVFDGEILLATFGSEKAALEYTLKV